MEGERGQERRKEEEKGRDGRQPPKRRRPYHAGLVIDPHKGDLPSGRLRRGCVRP